MVVAIAVTLDAGPPLAGTGVGTTVAIPVTVPAALLLLAAPVLTTTVLATIRATVTVAVPTALARTSLLGLPLRAAVGTAVAVAVLVALPHRLPGLAVRTLLLGAAHPAGVAIRPLLASRGTIRTRRPVGARAAGELRRGLGRRRLRGLGGGLSLGLTTAAIAARWTLASFARRVGLGFAPSIAAVLGDGGGARQQRQHQRGGDGLLHAHLRRGPLNGRPGRPLTKRMRPPI